MFLIITLIVVTFAIVLFILADRSQRNKTKKALGVGTAPCPNLSTLNWTWSFGSQHIPITLTPMPQNVNARPACFFTLKGVGLNSDSGNTTYAFFDRDARGTYNLYIDNTLDDEATASDPTAYWKFTSYSISGDERNGYQLRSQDGVTNSTFLPSQ